MIDEKLHFMPTAVRRRSRSAANARQDVVPSEIREISEDVVFRHTRSEIVQDIRHSDSHTANTRFPATFARFDGNYLAVVHGTQRTGHLVGRSSEGDLIVAASRARRGGGSGPTAWVVLARGTAAAVEVAGGDRRGAVAGGKIHRAHERAVTAAEEDRHRA